MMLGHDDNSPHLIELQLRQSLYPITKELQGAFQGLLLSKPHLACQKQITVECSKQYSRQSNNWMGAWPAGRMTQTRKQHDFFPLGKVQGGMGTGNAGMHRGCCKSASQRTRMALCLRLPGATALANALSSSMLVSYLRSSAGPHSSTTHRRPSGS